MKRLITRSAVAAAVLLLAACQSAPTYQESTTIDPQQVPKASSSQSSPEVQSPIALLLDQAWQFYRANQYQQAIEVAERGLRIERREAAFYLLIAQSYEALGQDSAASVFAQQGLRFAKPNSQLAARLQAIVSR